MALKIDFPDKYMSSDEELNDYLNKYELFKYVGCHSAYKTIEEEHPILKECRVLDCATYSSVQMNKILGFNLIPYQAVLSSFTINVFLNAYYGFRYFGEK